MGYFMARLIDMSVQAGIVVCAVLVLRILFRRMNLSAKYSLLLWVFPFFCMLCPWRFESAVAGIPSGDSLHGRLMQSVAGTEAVDENGMEALAETDGEAAEMDIVEEPIADVRVVSEKAEAIGEPISSDRTAASHRYGEYDRDNIAQFLFVFWIAGFVIVCLYGVVSCLRLRRKLVCSYRTEGNVYLADDVAAPFVFGIIRPRIYLPSDLSKEQEIFVLAHERTHIRRKDYLSKTGAFLLAGLHWFNPFAWIAFYYLAHDLELVCDEETLRGLKAEMERGGAIKQERDIAKEYAKILIEISVGQKRLATVPIAFGEGNVKRRIQSIMRNRKPIVGAAAAAVCLMGILAAAIVIRGKGKETGPLEAEQIITLDTSNGTVSVTAQDASEAANTESKEEGVEIAISPAEVTADVTIGADGTNLDYGDTERFVFHDYYGLFVYSIKEEKVVASLNLEEIGCKYTQGDRSCEVVVTQSDVQPAKDAEAEDNTRTNADTDTGLQVWLHRMDSDSVFCFDVGQNRLTQKKYSADEFNERIRNELAHKKQTNDCIDPDYTVFRSSECVLLADGNFLYLESGSGMAADLFYVLDKGGNKGRETAVIFDIDENESGESSGRSLRKEGITVIWDGQGNSGDFVETPEAPESAKGAEATVVEQAAEDIPDEVRKKQEKAQQEKEKALFKEYEKYGIAMKGKDMYYNGEKVRVFFDGYLITNEGGGTTSSVSRYHYFNEGGTARLRAVRLNTLNPDGTQTLFGELVDIVPYSEEAGSFVEKTINGGEESLQR